MTITKEKMRKKEKKGGKRKRKGTEGKGRRRGENRGRVGEGRERAESPSALELKGKQIQPIMMIKRSPVHKGVNEMNESFWHFLMCDSHSGKYLSNSNYFSL